MSRQTILRRILIAALCAGCAAPFLSCGPDGDTLTRPRPHILVDFTDGEPVSWRRMPTFYEDVPVYSWSIDDEPWTVNNAEIRPCGSAEEDTCDEGLIIRPSTGFPWLWRSVLPFDASEANLLKVETSFLRTSQMRFFWSTSEELFSPDAVILEKVTAPPFATLPIRRTHLIKLDHPMWVGKIGRLRLDPSQGHTQPTELHAFSLSKRRLDREGLKAHLDRPAMQDFSGDVRLALPAPPGHDLSREVGPLPPQAELSLAFGLQQKIGADVTFKIHAEMEDGRPIKLLERTLSPVGDHERWHDVEIDLSPFTGEALRLTLSTSGPAWEELVGGIPVWGHPRVSAAVEEPLPPNVLFVVADTLRADRTSFGGYSKKTTPNLDAWAEESAVVFENTVAAAPWTLPAHTSMLTGLDPFHHGANHGSGPWDDLTLLPEILRRHGYFTTAWTGGAYLTPTFGLAQGFQRFVYSKGGQDLDRHLPAALDFLESEPSEPFFLFFHTYETHAPYTPRSPWLELLSPELSETPKELRTRPGAPDPERGWRYDAHLVVGKGNHLQTAEAEETAQLDAVYDSSVARVDAAVGRLIRRVRSLGLESDTLIVFTSDHGEGLGDGGRFGHNTLFDEQIKIPLAISIPGRGGGRRVAAQVRQIDLTPTLLDALGLPPKRHSDGLSLLPFWDRDQVDGFPNTALSYAASSNYGAALRVDNQRKTILETAPWSSLETRRQVYDLHADPDELENLDGQGSAGDLDIGNLDIGDLDTAAALGRRYEARCHWRLRARNTSDSELRIVLGGAVTAYTLENPQPGCPECMDIEDGLVVLTLPPGRELDATLPPRSADDAHLVFEITGTPPLETLVPAERFETERFGWVLQRGEWQETGEAHDPSASGLWLTRQIDACPWMKEEQAPGAVVDDETTRQLKALGYRP